MQTNQFHRLNSLAWHAMDLCGGNCANSLESSRALSHSLRFSVHSLKIDMQL